jgi:hypothetical protein
LTQITLTPKTSFYANGIELWDSRQIAIEYGISKSSVRSMIALENFPKPYAITESGKMFFSVDVIRNWAETTPVMINVLRNKSLRRGRPVSTRKELITAIKQ